MDFTSFEVVPKMDEYSLEYSKTISELRGADHWITTEDYVYWLHGAYTQYFVPVPKDYITDGASVPSALNWILPKIGEYTAAAICHDYLCTTGIMYAGSLKDNVAINLTAQEVDDIFFSNLRYCGMGWARLQLVKAGIKLWRSVMKRPVPDNRRIYD